MSTTFYSWQSDLPNKCNRGLIEKALEMAVKGIRQHPEIQLAVREQLAVDKDTKGVPGSPNIADTILGKIASADACVFDVSIVEQAANRAFSNPNVLIELGYAMRAHREEKVILVANLAFGRVEDLPFDLRPKRVLTYNAPEDAQSLADERKALAGQLQRALELVYLHLEENRFSTDECNAALALHTYVANYLDSVAEKRQRTDRGGFQAAFESTASMLRDLSDDDVVRLNPSVAPQLKDLADDFDRVVTWEVTSADHREFEVEVQALADRASKMLEPFLPALTFVYGQKDYLREKARLVRRAVSEFDRFSNALSEKKVHTQNARRSLSDIGRSLLQLCRALEINGDPDAAALRKSGHALHASGNRGTSVVGYRPEEELHAQLAPLVAEIRRIGQS
ncbi:MAG: hypothetical protein AAF628_26890 [Planctomycetota bacterium]